MFCGKGEENNEDDRSPRRLSRKKQKRSVKSVIQSKRFGNFSSSVSIFGADQNVIKPM
jgi:hypothetical protein